MLAFVETLILSLMLFVWYWALFLPVGTLALRPLRIELSPSMAAGVGLAIGCLVWAALYAVLLLVGIPNSVIRLVLLGLHLLALAFWLARKGYEVLFTEDCRLGLYFFLLLFIVSLLFSTLPSGSFLSVNAQQVMKQTGLPIDNLIPYNFSRLLVDRLSLGSVEVVPTWKAADRGPLAPLLNASLFVLLDIKDESKWLSQAPGYYFLYQALMGFLSSFAVFVLWAIAVSLGGRKAGILAAVCFSLNLFTLQNTVHTWPKFSMAALFYLGAFLVSSTASSNKNSFVAGVLLGGAYLFHQSALFVVSILALSVLFQVIRERSRDSLVPFSVMLFGAASFVVPWVLYTSFAATRSPRLLYLHLFCIRDFDVSRLSFTRAFSRYLSENSVGDIVGTRLGNLWYPFDVFHLFEARINSLMDVYAGVTHLSFYQFVHAFGLPFLMLVVLAFIIGKSDSLDRARVLAGISLLGIIPASLIFGCELSTWNHHWAYPALLVAILPAAVLLRELPRWWAWGLFVMGLLVNILVCFRKFSTGPSSTEALWLFSLFLILVLARGVYELWFARRVSS